MTTPEIELKPCPFCGGEACVSTYETESLWSHNQVQYTKVSCDECDISFQTEPGHEPQTIEAWNTRATLPHLPSDGKWEHVGWMHPEAGWLHKDHGTIRNHCHKAGPGPVAVYAPLPAPPGSEVPAGQGVTVKAQLWHILSEMRDKAFGSSGKSSRQIEDYFNNRAADALEALSALTATKTPDEIRLADEERAHTETIKERDAYHDWADRLARAIGGEEIGEHSNLNNPWQNALEIAEARRDPDEIRREALKEAANVAYMPLQKYEDMLGHTPTEAVLFLLVGDIVAAIRALAAKEGEHG